MSTNQSSRQEIIATLAQVKNVGDFRAKQLYDELNVRSIETLVELAQRGELTHSVQGIGKATESKILDSASAMLKASQGSPELIVAATTPDEPQIEDVRLDAVEALHHEPTNAPDVDASNDAVASPLLHEVLICPNCGNDAFIAEPDAGITCRACRREYVERLGVIDLAPPYRQAHSPSQRLMESRFYARFYEDVMRPRLTSLVTSRTMREEYALSADLLDLEPASRVLDVACGTANFTRYFARRLDASRPQDEAPSALLVGVDLSLPMLEVARQSIAREDLIQTIHLIRGDAGRLPFERESFDRLHCAGALHLMEDPDEVLRNFACVLEPDGILVISTFVQGDGLIRRLAKKLAEIPTKFRWFSLDDLHEKLQHAGFELLDEFVEEDALTIKARRI